MTDTYRIHIGYCTYMDYNEVERGRRHFPFEYFDPLSLREKRTHLNKERSTIVSESYTVSGFLQVLWCIITYTTLFV